jgi:glycosyltransferase involved in cell wall biosynthesis
MVAPVIPRVSVVIPTYNHARWVAQAVQSVAAQRFRDLEIIVVDDGSTDDTARIVRQTGVPLRYVHQDNRGLSGARNTGVATARGDLVGFLDADDLWLPDKLGLQVQLLDACPRAALVYADAVLFDEQARRPLGTHADRHAHPSGRILAALLLDNPIPSPTPLVRRAALQAAGGFDETLRACEDWDMWIRLARRAEIHCIDRPLAVYRLHGDNMHGDVARMKRHQHAVLRRALADPRLPAAIRRQGPALVAHRHREFGLLHFGRGEYAAARGELARAVRHRPALLLDPRVGPRLLVSLLGRRAAARLVAWRRLALARTA